ncbi:ATP-binding protein [Macrococcus capreoli]|uniref:ATP-binding protein n=1 Tax=Macrococcus capreoli TaxID=2982690 RepID=UPI0021D5C6FD|nr:ATP-binding protein [Macrococcus sp. TMW 2.2395]MCU7557638.1 ATP-binding protein [Macrococcus sp. TMW 2.2395]
MDLKTPYHKVKGNLLLNRFGEVWAYYRINSEAISTANYEAKEDVKKKMRYFMESLQHYEDFHLEMYEHDLDLRNKFNEISKDFDDDCFDVARYYADETINILEQDLNMITHYSFVMGVKLRELSQESVTFKEVLKTTFNDTTEKIISSFGYDVDIDFKLLERYQLFEKELAEKMLVINGIRLSEEDLRYICRKPYISNETHDVKEQSSKMTRSQISNVIIDPSKHGILKIENEDEAFYSLTVVVDEFPADMEYTHIFEKAQNLSFPVECHIKGRFLDNDNLNKRFNRKRTLQKSQFKERLSVEDNVTDDALENKFVFDEIESEIKGKGVFLEWSYCFVIKGSSYKDVKRKAKRLIERFEQVEIYCVSPLADQLQLFYLNLHGNKLNINRYWMQISNTVAFGENLFGVSQNLGTKTGFYIGRIDKYMRSLSLEDSIASSRDIVLFSLLLASKGISGAASDSPHVMISGETGKGKSFLAKLLWIYTSFFNGQQIYWDPKSEFAEWFNKVSENEEIAKKYPLFVKHIKTFKYVTLDYQDETNYGCLDPIVFLNGVEAKEMLKSVFDEIKSFENYHHIETALYQAITDVVEMRENGEIVGSLDVIKILQQSEDKGIKDAGDLLFEKTQNNILQLVFSDGKNEALSIETKSTILQVRGLDLPRSDDAVESYTTSERNGITLVLLVGKFLEKFGSRNDVTTTTFVDEGWAFGSSKQGKKVFKNMKRTGRSFNNSLVFITQSVNDKADDDNSNFGCHFAFDDPRERLEILEALSLEYSEESPENLEMLKDMKKGQCMFRDFYGRVGKMAVHCPFEEMTMAFKTTEDNASSIAENKFAI